MTTLPEILLTASVTGFTAGSIIDFGGFNFNPSWTATLPMGAVFFGLFLISFMLEKEMAKFDEEEAEKFELARHNEADGSNRKNCQCQTVSATAA